MRLQPLSLTLLREEALSARDESDFMAAVKRLAEFYGWLYYHTYDSRRSERGFPDCALAKDGVLLLWELKSPRGSLREAQKRWLNTLGDFFVGCSGVYRPADTDEIISTLQGVDMFRKIVLQLARLVLDNPLPDTVVDAVARRFKVRKSLVRELETELRNHLFGRISGNNSSELTNSS